MLGDLQGGGTFRVRKTTSRGGELFDEGLQKRVDFDIAPDARLSAPTPQLGRPALEARVRVVDTGYSQGTCNFRT